jgi:hypothetical protein
MSSSTGSVLGRFNLIFIDDVTAALGYRVARQVAGQGVATATVGELSQLAAEQHGLCRLRAATSHQNICVAEGAAQHEVRRGRPGRPDGSRGQGRHLVRARPRHDVMHIVGTIMTRASMAP